MRFIFEATRVRAIGAGEGILFARKFTPGRLGAGSRWLAATNKKL
jgi:hypothetical protein